MSTGTRFFGLLLAIALLIGAFIADWYLIRRAMAQHASGVSWQQTTGTIVTTTVTSRKVKNGRRYRAAVTYAYEAAGETRTGSTIVVDESEAPSFRSESAAKSAFPQGGSVPVYVDPADPTNAALVVGLQKKTIALLYFAGVLNAFALTMLRPSIRSFGVRGEPIRYYLIEDDASRAVLRLSHLNALEFGVMWIGLASIAVGLGVLLLPSSVPMAWIGLPILAGVGVLGFVWRFAAHRAGRFDIVVDRASGFVTFPPGIGRAAVVQDMALVDQIELRDSTVSNSKNKQPTADIYVHTADTEPRALAKWIERGEAELLAKWLRRECALDSDG
jgi:hypothetical protein